MSQQKIYTKRKTTYKT